MRLISSKCIFTLAIVSIISTFAFKTIAAVPVNYTSAISQEMVRLGLAPRCTSNTTTCISTTDIIVNAQPLDLTIKFSQETHTVYIGFERFWVLGKELDAPLSATLLRLNHELVSAKFSFREDVLAIELSTSIDTDSNFDRRAFRSQVTGLIEIASKVQSMLNIPSTLPKEQDSSQKE